MIELHAELRKKKIPTYIFFPIPTTSPWNTIRRSFPFFGHFDGYILSYEVGSMKPNAKIYEALEAMTGRRGEDIFLH